MRTIYITLLTFIWSTTVMAQQPNISEIRKLYQEAATQEKACKLLKNELKDYLPASSHILAGYKACATMMMANYLFDPFSKLSHFSEGKSLLEACIEQDKENIELRFLRFAIQSNIPSFLGYKNRIDEDKKLLLKNINQIKDSSLKVMIKDFLLKSPNLTSLEKSQIK